MTFVQWVVGAVSSALLIAAIVSAGRAIRRRLLPDVDGPAAVLVTWTAGLSSAVALAQLLGAVALFRRPVIDLVCVVVIGLTRRTRRGRAPAPRRPRPRAVDLPTALVALAVVAVVGLWVSRAAHAFRWGVVTPDSLDYELPLALSYVQTHRIGPVHLVTPGAPTAYYPQGAVVEHGLAMLLLRRDLLSPLISLADLMLALLAAGVLGQRFGAARRALLAACVVGALPVVLATNAGAAKDDVATAAWVVATLALLAHALPRTPDEHIDARWLAPAGLSLGMAVDVKLSAGPPAVVIALALAVLLGRGQRRRAVAFVAAMLPAGAFWYVRDIALVGTPAPSVRLGPLPHADFSLAHLQARSLARALSTTRGDLGDHYVPYLDRVVTSAWPVLAVLVVGGAVLGLVPVVRRRSAAGLLGLVALAALAAFIGTPGTAGPVGDASIALSNVRYATMPVLLCVLALVVVTARVPVVSAAVCAGMVCVLVAAVFGRWRLTAPDPTGARWLACSAVVAAIVIAVVVLRRFARTLGPVSGPRRAAGALLGAAVLVVGFPLARHLVRDRYAPGAHERSAWGALAQTHGLRVAVVGGALKYPLAGARLSNRVDEIGVRTPHGGFERPTTCEQVATALAGRHYDYVYLELTADPHLTPRDLTTLTTGDPLAVDGADALYAVHPNVGVARCTVTP